MKWFVDDSEIRTDRAGMTTFKVVLDDEVGAKVSNLAIGRFEIPWKKRTVEFLRISAGKNSVETELWANGVRVPPSNDAARRGEPKACDPHKKRTPRRCSRCDEAMCRRCASVDGARCESCFEEATGLEMNARRKGWLIGAAFMALVGVGLFYWGTQSPGSPAGRFAGAAVFGAVYMVYVAFRKRAVPDSMPSSGPLPFEALEGRDQLVGNKCGACKERIAEQANGLTCGTCRNVLHQRCVDGHTCKAAKFGPQWDVIAA